MTVPFLYNFQNNFLKFNFSHFTPQVRLFFVEERKAKIFGFKNVMERGISKILTFIIRQIESKIFSSFDTHSLATKAVYTLKNHFF